MCFECDAEPVVEVHGDRVRVSFFSMDGDTEPNRVFVGALTPKAAVQLLGRLKLAVDEITSPAPAANVTRIRARMAR